MSTSKLNGKIQCNVLSEGFFQVDDVLEEIFSDGNNNQPKEDKEERKEGA